MLPPDAAAVAAPAVDPPRGVAAWVKYQKNDLKVGPLTKTVLPEGFIVDPDVPTLNKKAKDNTKKGVSNIWHFFDLFDPEAEKEKEGLETHAACKECQRRALEALAENWTNKDHLKFAIYRGTESGTSNLIKHLKNHHTEDLYQKLLDMDAETLKKEKLLHGQSGTMLKYVNNHDFQEQMKKATLEFVILSDQSLR